MTASCVARGDGTVLFRKIMVTNCEVELMLIVLAK